MYESLYESEYELEALPEWEEEYAYEGEWEDEFEGDFESEAFFRSLARVAQRTVKSPLFRKLRTLLMAGKLSTTPIPQDALPPPPPPMAIEEDRRRRGRQKQLPPDQEFEDEWEWEEELNSAVSPNTLMEHCGHRATTVESEAEAEAFIGALIPLAARLVPRAASTIMRAAPRLIRGASRVARTLRRSPATRPLVRTIPTIVRRTAMNLARQASQGRPVTPRTAVQTLARQATRVISSPRQSVQAYRRSRALDRRFHGAARAGRV